MKQIAKLGALGASVLLSTCLTIGMGAASADSIMNTGPGSTNKIVSIASTTDMMLNKNNVSFTNQNSQVATSGNATVSNNTSNDQHTKHKHDCGQQNQYGTKPAGYNSGGQTAGWSYQKPTTWQPSPSGNAGDMSVGSAVTGNASNANATNAAVTVTNTDAQANTQPMNNAGSADTIDNTGPRSLNTITSVTSNDNQVTNTNTISFTNTNNQVATTGSATVSGNTFGGSARSGNASNMNSTSFTASIVN